MQSSRRPDSTRIGSRRSSRTFEPLEPRLLLAAQMVRDLNPPTALPVIDRFVALGDTVFFTTDSGTHGRELWTSDGTRRGTVLVKDINPGGNGSDPDSLTVANGVLYFTADDGVNGREMWRTDGTTAGTTLVKDVKPGRE